MPVGGSAGSSCPKSSRKWILPEIRVPGAPRRAQLPPGTDITAVAIPGPAPSSKAAQPPRVIHLGAQKNSKYSRISQSLTSGPGGPSEAGPEVTASEYRRISARFIITR